ncbi:4Fe-4S dicluster domain-containing protein [Methanobacterium paludis]|uniref:Ferredoxin n=1 Tax=Methanobacterium paludis (strain DSM 25820 / JCM 18151 / SWAN1) TaxID=868131 RepID=F6D756_METPW|nr:4Fe-4S dicluster domain-containing protein [Methanobacterium paludis]AEG19015.1 ferredoxin [Methanobacterium paludis]
MLLIDIALDHEHCEGSKCGGCAYVCPTNVFSIKKDKISINSPQYCKLCYNCLEICPKAVINIKTHNAIPAYY